LEHWQFFVVTTHKAITLAGVARGKEQCVRANRMRIVDAFCGAGGWSAGAVAAGCTPVLGIDSDSAPLKLWAANCSHTGRAVCAIIGVDDVDWPEAAQDLHVHLSPPCTSLSKARAGSASAASVANALDAVRWCVQLVLDKGYASWSMENVATPAVVACVAELARQHPDRVAHITLDAADYGVGTNRVRLIASTPAVIKARCSLGTAYRASLVGLLLVSSNKL
jgi:site-specific DNA-cytosine methylase